MSDSDTVRIDPIHTREVNGEKIVDEYTFGKVHIDDIPDDYHNDYVDFEKGVERVRWQYPGKCPILLDEDGAIARESAPREEAQNQAYFAMSMLADDGYVSRFRKK